MSNATTAKFGNKKTKQNFFEEILAKFDPIWTGAYGFESQLSEKKYVHVCVYAVVENFNIALDLSLTTRRLECIFYLLRRHSKRYRMDSKSREAKIWYRAYSVLIEVLGEKKKRLIRFLILDVI